MVHSKKDRPLLDDKYPIESSDILLILEKTCRSSWNDCETFADGVDECQKIPLTKDKLRSIIDAVKSDKLVKDHSGFFFGNSTDNGSYSEESKAETVESFELAMEFLEDDEQWRDVWYRASW